MRVQTIPLLLLGCLLLGRTSGQTPEETFVRKIEAEGDYTHSATGTVFPERIGPFERVDITVFDRDARDAGAHYQLRAGERTPRFTVYIYPTDGTDENSFRTEYRIRRTEAILAQPKPAKFVFRQYPVRREGPQYVCNGFTMQGSCPKGELTRLTLFECGKWFLKFRISAAPGDTTGIGQIERLLLDRFDPTALTALEPYSGKSNLHIAPAALADSVLFSATARCTFKKLEWIRDRIPDNEKASGFPGLYLAMHVEAQRAFLRAADSALRLHRMNETARHRIQALQRVADAGFLEEYLYDQYDRVMIVPDSMKLDMENFEKWKAEAGDGIDLQMRSVFQSVIVYADGEPEDASPPSPE